MTTDLEKVLGKSRAALFARDEAAIAVVAIRALESELRAVAVAAGGHLRGLPNIARDYSSTATSPKGPRTYAANVRAKSPDKPMSRTRTSTSLVLTLDGRLCLATWEPALSAFALRPVRDDELRAEDVAALAAVAVWVLGRHGAACERSEASYLAAAVLSRRLLAALGTRGGL